MRVVLPRKSSLGEYKRRKGTAPGVYEYDGYEWKEGKAPEFVCSCCRDKLPLSEPTHSNEDLDTLKGKLKCLWEVTITVYPNDSTSPLDTFYTLQECSMTKDDVRHFVYEIFKQPKDIS